MTKNFKTYVELLEYRAIHQPEDIAYIYSIDNTDNEISITYSELEKRAKAVASVLQNMELSGKRALLLYTPGFEFIISFLGCLCAGVIAVPAYPPEINRIEHTLKRIATIIGDARTSIILTTSDLYKQAEKIFSKFPNTNLDKMKWLESDKVGPEKSKQWEQPDINGDTIAFLQYTSGSTSNPKGVIISHTNLLTNEEMMKQALGHYDKNVMVCWVPFYHDMGLIGHMLQTLYIGSKTVIMSPISFLQNPIKWLQLIEKHQATSSGAPNFAFELCVRKISDEKAAQLDLSRFNTAASGAEPINYKTVEKFIQHFEKSGFKREYYRTLYGLAEATVFVTGSPLGEPPFYYTIKKDELEKNKVIEDRSGSENNITLVSSGEAWCDLKIVIVNPDTKIECKPDEIGEIWVSGPNVAKGYWNLPELTQETFHAYLADTNEGPFMRTGDLGFLFDKKLFVTGRIKDMIIIRGRNIYPQDIERDIESLRTKYQSIRPGCGSAFSITINDQENLVILQELDSKSEITNPDEIISSIIKEINVSQNVHIHSIVLLQSGSLAKTSSGKIMRQACKKAFLSDFKDKSYKVIKKWSANDDNLVNSESSNVLDSKDVLKNVSKLTNKTKNEIEEWLINWLANEFSLSKDNIDNTKNFSFYGVDSATSISLVKELEDFLKIELYETILWDYQNINSLISFLIGGTPELNEKPDLNQNNSILSQNDKVAVIGMACRLPSNVYNVNTPEIFWKSLSENTEGISKISTNKWSLDKYYSPSIEKGKMYVDKGGFLSDIDKFEPEFFGISPREAINLDPQQRLLLEVTYEAFENAGIISENLKNSQTGVFIGISSQDYSKFNINSGNTENIDVYSGTGNAYSVASGRISYTFGLQGPNLSVDTACSSSLVAVHLAAKSILSGEADLAVAGGVNLIISPDTTIYFCQLNALSKDGYCKTFDDSADGYIRSEGCGIVVLKKLSEAIRDNDNILGVISASEINHDGNSNGLTAPNGQAQKKLLERTLKKSGFKENDISYLEAHGTGTPLGDPIEMRAITDALCNNRTEKLIVGSVKSNIGHTEAAAGVAGLIKVLLAMKNKKIPANLHFNKLNSKINYRTDTFQIANKLMDWNVDKKVAGISSFGISGTNAHVIVEDYTQQKNINNAESVNNTGINILTITAKTKESLIQNALSYQKYLDENYSDIYNICFTANQKRNHFNYKLVAVFSEKTDLNNQLQSFINDDIDHGIYFSHIENNFIPKVAFIFPGQGSQWLGMGKDLFNKEIVFRESIKKCEQAFKKYVDWSLIDFITANNQIEKLEQIDIIQPALFAVEVALAELWKSLGIKPEAVIGHSMGETAAAYISGALDLDDAAKIICERSKLLKQKVGQGSMLLTELNFEQAKEIIKEYKDIDIAVCNSPKITVLSGNTDSLTELSKYLEEKSLFNRWVKVNVASHCRQMDSLKPELLDLLNDVSAKENEIPIYSTVTGKALNGIQMNNNYWVDNLRETVLFKDAVEQAISDGFNTFIEMSPHPILLAMVDEILNANNKKGYSIASLTKNSDEIVSFYNNLGLIYSLGININWNKIYPNGLIKQLPNYQWNRERYWVDDVKPPENSLVNLTVYNSFFTNNYQLANGLKVQEISFKNSLIPDFLKHITDNENNSAEIKFQVSIFAELALTALLNMIGKGFYLEKIKFLNEISFFDKQQLQVILTPQDNNYFFELFSNSGSDYDLAINALTRKSSDEKNPEDNLAIINNLKSNFTDKYSQNDFYKALDYSNEYQVIKDIWQSKNEVLAKINLEESLFKSNDISTLHIIMLDACFALLDFSANEIENYQLNSIDSLKAFQRPNTDLWCHINFQQDNKLIKADIILFDKSGFTLFEAKGIKFQNQNEAEIYHAPKNVDDWLYRLQWVNHDLVSKEIQNTASKWLIFEDSESVSDTLKLLMESRKQNYISVIKGNSFKKLGNNNFNINPENPDDYQKLFSEITLSEITRIIHLWSIDSTTNLDIINLEKANTSGFLSAVNLLKAIENLDKLEDIKLFFITNGVYYIDNDKSVNFNQAALQGLNKVINYEYPELRATTVDLGFEINPFEIASLFSEINTNNQETNIVLRQENRFVARYKKYKSEENQQIIAPREEDTGLLGKFKNYFKPVESIKEINQFEKIYSNATYLVTGGLGGLGIIFTNWLLENGAKNIVLTGRTNITKEKQSYLDSIKKDANIVYIAADISRADNAEKLFSQIKHMAPLKGIIHSAGLISDGSINTHTKEKFSDVMSPKAHGLINLHNNSLEFNLDFFVLFSSMVAQVGLTGLANYAGANSFMDSFAYFRRLNNVTALSINWGPWSDSGLASYYDQKDVLKSQGIESISPELGVKIFDKLIRENTVQVSPIAFNFRKLFAAYPVAKQIRLFENMIKEQNIDIESINVSKINKKANISKSVSVKVTEDKSLGKLNSELLLLSSEDRYIKLKEIIRKELSNILKISVSKIEDNNNFRDYGFDSLMALELVNKLEYKIGAAIPASNLKEYSTVHSLANFLNTLE